MSAAVVRCIGFLILATIVATLTWSSCQAAGSFQTKPAFPSAVTADDDQPPPAITWPNRSASVFVGGCGRGRIIDPQTQGCRGLADIPSIAQ
jgi:hypothetical protein